MSTKNDADGPWQLDWAVFGTCGAAALAALLLGFWIGYSGGKGAGYQEGWDAYDYQYGGVCRPETEVSP